MSEPEAEVLRPVVSETEPNSSGYQPYMDTKPPTPPIATLENFTFPSHLPTPPFIDIDGVPNFRDMGGYLLSSSYLSVGSISNTKPFMVRKGLLYRCAHPTLITPDGLKKLTEDLDVRTIYDLRSAPEIQKLAASLNMPTDPKAAMIPGITRHFVPVYEEVDYSPVALARKLQWYTAKESDAGYSEGFVRSYRDIALHGVSAYTTIFRHILNTPEKPLAFHCTAGKDRTGVLGAMILRLCGVDNETICWEYAITEPGLGSWRDLFIDRISRGGLGQAGAPPKGSDAHAPVVDREEAARIVGSRAGNIRAFMRNVLDSEFGGVEKYLSEKCSFTAEEIEIIRKNLVVPVDSVKDIVRPVGIDNWTADGGVIDVGSPQGAPLGLNVAAGREVEEKVLTG